MNKIYKVIWSKAKNCYVVVSEKLLRSGIGTGQAERKMQSCKDR